MEKSIALFLVLIGLIFSDSYTTKLPGFKISPFFDEQVATFNLKQDMHIQINAPAVDQFDKNKPVGLVLYALPNGNTIEQTVGRSLQSGDDWHYDIQHIGAQTRFLRQKVDYNLVVVYLEAGTKSWPAWKRNYPQDHAEIIKQTVDYLSSLFVDYKTFIILNGHSGGGRFIFSFMDAFSDIPANVQRICFLDSDYGYEKQYAEKIVNWLNGPEKRYLSVMAYNDSVALYNGKRFVSDTGGTWYRTKMMYRDLSRHFTFKTTENDSFINHFALMGRIKIYLKKNPQKEILHTVQVERNGFIHSMLTGTLLEQDGYRYYSRRCYKDFIQQGELKTENINIPLRSPISEKGTAFMSSVEKMSFEDREKAIGAEFFAGNVPYFLRDLKTLTGRFFDADSQPHQVTWRVFPDYLAIGSDDDYCRIPMGPLTAQMIADFYNCSLPTRKLVNHIYTNAEIKLAPVSYRPVGNENEKVYMFVKHNTAIDSQLQAAEGHPGQLVAGIKKDVVLSNKIADSTRTHHVTIYGWHKLDGIRIQPLTNIHIDSYVDYSHGIRFIDRNIKIDSTYYDITTILKDKILYKLLSDESGPMTQTSY